MNAVGITEAVAEVAVSSAAAVILITRGQQRSRRAAANDKRSVDGRLDDSSPDGIILLQLLDSILNGAVDRDSVGFVDLQVEADGIGDIVLALNGLHASGSRNLRIETWSVLAPCP